MRLSSREYSFGIDVLHRRQRSEHRGVEHEHVELLPPLGDRARELADALAFGEVERRDRRAAAGVVDPLLDLLERRGGAGDEDHVRAGRGKRFRGRRANAAAGAGDQRELAGKGFESVMAPPVAA